MASGGTLGVEVGEGATVAEPVVGARPAVPLVFEESSSGRRGIDQRDAAASERRAREILGSELCRATIPGFPELSEPQVLRHFLRLSQFNFGQALNFYPLGSCTMKYNPVVNDEVAALPGFAALHPHTPAPLAQGALELIVLMERALAEITGMDAASLHPAAGAQGELAGLLIVRAWDALHGGRRAKVIIPDTAHGTNPASCTLAGFKVVVARTGPHGYLEAAEIRRLVDDEVAALMVTNPNTMGIFEPEIVEIAGTLHERGALLYLDGANLNALLGVAEAWRYGRGYRPRQPAQDLLDAARRGRTRRGSDRGEARARAVPARAASGAPRRPMGLGSRAAVRDRQAEGFLRQFRDARAGADLYPRARRRRS